MPRSHTEHDFQSSFRAWATHNTKTSTAYELKSTDTHLLNFNRLEPHQFASLHQSKHNALYVRLPDTDYLNKKPYDCLVMSGTPAYVAVMFRQKEIGQKEFYLIDVDVWEEEEAKSKSLSEQRASEVGIRCQLL